MKALEILKKEVGTCSTCEGTGENPNSGQECEVCQGSGKDHS